MPAPLNRDGAGHWAALPTRSRDSGGDGGLTAKEAFYDALHSCVAGAGDIHSSLVRPKAPSLHTDRSGYTTGTDGNLPVNTYTDRYGNTTGWIGGKYVSTYSDGYGGTTGTIGNKRITTYDDGYGNTTGPTVPVPPQGQSAGGL